MDSRMDEMRRLADVINEAAYQYYVLDDPHIPDTEYDKLYDQLIALENETGERLPDSPTRRVGGQTLPSFAPHRHISRLWSLDKCQTREALSAWMVRTKNQLGFSPSYFAEYKFDGLTLNLTYDNGRLIQAATRGNGETGESVLAQAMTVSDIPHRIPYRGFMEVNGECYMKLSVLNQYNKEAEEPLKNARNAAAGALRNLDPEITASRRLSALFYNIGTIKDPPYSTRDGLAAFLKDNGFPVSPYLIKADTADSIWAIVEQAEAERRQLDFLIDGIVVGVSDISLREALGYTDKFPRWAIACKFKAEEIITTIRSISWELGRTGKLTPLAHLDDTDFMGVTVRRATLNNYGDIERKAVAVGCRVRLRRSNDVIPEIVGRVGKPIPGETPVIKPSVCPACGAPVRENGANLYCVNKAGCEPQAVARLVHFAGRDAMDIEGLSEKTCALLYKHLAVRDPADLYAMDADSLRALEGFGDKKTQNLLEALDKSRSAGLDALLYAIGIPNVGRKTARDLAGYFGTLTAVMNAAEAELTMMDDVGAIIAGSVVRFFADTENRDLLQKLLERGVIPRGGEPTPSSGWLTGMSVVVTGTLANMTRARAEELIRAAGGNASGAVSRKTAFVVAGENAGSKLDKAAALGIPVLTETEFMIRIGT